MRASRHVPARQPDRLRSRERGRQHRVGHTVLATALITALTAVPAAAQRIEFDGVASRGDRPETHRLLGYTARVSMPLLPLLDVGVGYSRLAGSGEIEGIGCDGNDGISCSDEAFSNDFVFSTVDYEVVLPLRLLGFELTGAAGVDVTTLRNATVRGVESGTVLRAEAPEHGLLGSLTSFNGKHYRIGAGFSPLIGLPVTVRAAWQRRITDLDACAADGWTPFCGEMKADQLMLGISIGTR